MLRFLWIAVVFPGLAETGLAAAEKARVDAG